MRYNKYVTTLFLPMLTFNSLLNSSFEWQNDAIWTEHELITSFDSSKTLRNHYHYIVSNGKLSFQRGMKVEPLSFCDPFEPLLVNQFNLSSRIPGKPLNGSMARGFAAKRVLYRNGWHVLLGIIIQWKITWFNHFVLFVC